MLTVILNKKLPITPEHLYKLVHDYLIFYSPPDLENKNAYGYYHPELIPKSESFQIVNPNGELMANVSVLPLNPLSSRVVVTFDNWEDSKRQHPIMMGWHGASLEPTKKRMVLDVIAYALSVVLSQEQAAKWLSETYTLLDKQVTELPPEHQTPLWEQIGQTPPIHREIVRLMCEGLSDKKIGDILHLSEKTIANHLTKIRKLYPHLPLQRSEVEKQNKGN